MCFALVLQVEAQVDRAALQSENEALVRKLHLLETASMPDNNRNSSIVSSVNRSSETATHEITGTDSTDTELQQRCQRYETEMTLLRHELSESQQLQNVQSTQTTTLAERDKDDCDKAEAALRKALVQHEAELQLHKEDANNKANTIGRIQQEVQHQQQEHARQLATLRFTFEGEVEALQQQLRDSAHGAEETDVPDANTNDSQTDASDKQVD